MCFFDGMLVVQERTSANTPSVTYTRGNDLSGTVQGAGGIGGLLARSHGYSTANGGWSTHNYYHADGNGNITAMVNSSEALVASYKYDPFGNLVAGSGSLAGANTYRFSSKEVQSASGIYYYGYRFYYPFLQRWLNQDPVGETGGNNLHAFALNQPFNFVDPFGMDPFLIVNPEDYPVPPTPPPGSEGCLSAQPSDSNSGICEKYGSRNYAGVSLKCFCKSAPNDDWSKKVRGCLACMDAKGVSVGLAHSLCYSAADKEHRRPVLDLAETWLKCANPPKCIQDVEWAVWPY